METTTRPLLQEIIQILKKQSVFTKENLSFAEACEYLDLSASCLYKLTSQRKLPYYTPNGKRIYFKKVELDTWVTKNRSATQEEIERHVTETLTQK